MYTPMNFDCVQIPGTINHYPNVTKVGTTSDGYIIWEMNDYYSLRNNINETFPLSKLKSVSVDLTVSEESVNPDTEEITSQQTLTYVTGTPQHKNQYSFIPVDGTQFIVEFTAPADFNFNDGVSLAWNDGLPNGGLNIW